MHNENIKKKLFILYEIYKHKKTRSSIKPLLFITISYAMSSIDFIPDVIPFIGKLDDMVFINLMTKIAYSRVDKEILKECEIKIAENSNYELEDHWYYSIITISSMFIIAIIAYYIGKKVVY